MNWISIATGNGLSPERRHTITWINAELFSIVSLETNVSEIHIKLDSFSFVKAHVKMPFVKWPLFCLPADELINCISQGPIAEYA